MSQKIIKKALTPHYECRKGMFLLPVMVTKRVFTATPGVNHNKLIKNE